MRRNGMSVVITRLCLSACEMGESGRAEKEIASFFLCSPVNHECSLKKKKKKKKNKQIQKMENKI